MLRYSACMNEFYLNADTRSEILYKIYKQPNTTYHSVSANKIEYQKQPSRKHVCQESTTTNDFDNPDMSIEQYNSKEPDKNDQAKIISVDNWSQQQYHHDHVYDYCTISTTWQDGYYWFIIFTEGKE